MSNTTTELPAETVTGDIALTPEQLSQVKPREEAVYDREAHWLQFQAATTSYPKKKVVRMLFEAAEAITFLEHQVKSVDKTTQLPPEIPEENKKRWLGRKNR